MKKAQNGGFWVKKSENKGKIDFKCTFYFLNVLSCNAKSVTSLGQSHVDEKVMIEAQLGCHAQIVVLGLKKAHNTGKIDFKYTFYFKMCFLVAQSR